MKTKYIKLSILSLSLALCTASAAVDAGHIDSVSHYVKVCHDVSCSSYGNINFLPTQTSTSSPVVITDTSITGYLWGDELGWINLAPTGAGVTVDPNTGMLYGTAFSQSAGWINFRPTNGGVSINSNGEFVGFAWNGGQYGGWIKFDCSVSASCVKTDWRVVSQRQVDLVVSPVTNTNPGSLFITPGIIPIIVPAVVNPTPRPVATSTPIQKINTIVKNITDTVIKKVEEITSPRESSEVAQNTNNSVSSGSGPSLIAVNNNSNFIPSNTSNESASTFLNQNIKNLKDLKDKENTEYNQSTKKNYDTFKSNIIEKIKSSASVVAVTIESFMVLSWKSFISFLNLL